MFHFQQTAFAIKQNEWTILRGAVQIAIVKTSKEIVEAMVDLMNANEQEIEDALDAAFLRTTTV